MGAVIFVIALASVFLGLSIFLFCGKGSWLIAGYNTMSVEEKAKFDEKKLCKGAGIVTVVVSLMLYVMAYLGYKVELGTMSESRMLPFAIVFILVVLATVGIAIFYMNNKCKRQ